MNIALFIHLKPSWTIDISQTDNILRIYDGEKTSFFNAFGSKIDDFGMHDLQELSPSEANAYSFSRLCSFIEDAPPELVLVLLTLQEGDMRTETLELIEMGATFILPDFLVRGKELLIFHLLRYDHQEFKLLGLIGPKQRK